MGDGGGMEEALSSLHLFSPLWPFDVLILPPSSLLPFSSLSLSLSSASSLSTRRPWLTTRYSLSLLLILFLCFFNSAVVFWRCVSFLELVGRCIVRENAVCFQLGIWKSRCILESACLTLLLGFLGFDFFLICICFYFSVFVSSWTIEREMWCF